MTRKWGALRDCDETAQDWLQKGGWPGPALSIASYSILFPHWWERKHKVYRLSRYQITVLYRLRFKSQFSNLCGIPFLRFLKIFLSCFILHCSIKHWKWSIPNYNHMGCIYNDCGCKFCVCVCVCFPTKHLTFPRGHPVSISSVAWIYLNQS